MTPTLGKNIPKWTQGLSRTETASLPGGKGSSRLGQARLWDGTPEAQATGEGSTQDRTN